MGAWVAFGRNFGPLAFQSITDRPPEQFWDIAGLKNQRFVQFVAHLEVFGVHFGPILVACAP